MRFIYVGVEDMQYFFYYPVFLFPFSIRSLFLRICLSSPTSFSFLFVSLFEISLIYTTLDILIESLVSIPGGNKYGVQGLVLCSEV
ncbi:hypothetical protein V8F20_004936 [Naviculisporaceae sp. PSN 640]